MHRALCPLRRGRGQKPGTALVRSEPPSVAARLLVALIILAFAVTAMTPTGTAARTAPDSFADLAERLLPSVVNISTSQTVEGQSGIEIPQVPPGSPFEEFFREFFERSQPQRRRRATSLGSGFIIDQSGHIVTNNHVIQDADEITVILHDEVRLDAEVIGRDPKTDLAVLKVNPAGADLRPVVFGDSDRVRVGDWALAIGNPFGFGGTVTAGIISARSRDINAGPYDDFLQTDASINRGNSGGPMFNLDGQVIGIATAIFSPSGGSVGIGFAIPSTVAQPVIEQLIAFGEVRRGWLGVRIQTVTDELAESLGLDSARGALVADVIPGGPAAAAGLQRRDVVLEFDGEPVEEMRKLPRIVAETDVGRTVPVKVWRDNREVTIDVTLGSLEEGEQQMAAAEGRTPSRGSEEMIAPLGLTVSAIGEEQRQEYDLGPDSKGVVVTEVDADGAAAAKNIRPGDVIVEVDQDEVDDPGDLITKIEAAKERDRKSVLLLVEGAGGLRFVAVRIAQG